jgi:hypothetical protein
MPNYICDSMLAPLREVGVQILGYSIDATFDIAQPIELEQGDWFYYVNYFGTCAANVDRILSRYPADRVVLDFCQAFFEPPRECLAVIYSPRKFFGVPDGGLLLSQLPVAAPSQVDADSVGRARYLLARLGGSAESGYAAYQESEQSLTEMEPRGMSQLTGRILDSVDRNRTKAIRNENFALLHEFLGARNQLAIDIARTDGPLSYPFFIDAPGLRARLIGERVFVPTYWPDTLERVTEDSCEAAFVRKLIPLPCDQRYGAREMKKIARICTNFLDG